MDPSNYPGDVSGSIPAAAPAYLSQIVRESVLSSPRQFEIRLKFAEGEIVKSVYLDDPQMTVESANERIRAAHPDTDGLTKFGGQDYGDILRADVRNGMILECRDNRLIPVLHFAQSGGHVFATDFEILNPSPKSPSQLNACGECEIPSGNASEEKQCLP